MTRKGRLKERQKLGRYISRLGQRGAVMISLVNLGNSDKGVTFRGMSFVVDILNLRYLQDVCVKMYNEILEVLSAAQKRC